MFDRGYIRETNSGPDMAAQEAAVRAAGVKREDWVYADRLPPKRKHRSASADALAQRTRVIRHITDGRIIVPSLDRFGISAIDIMRAISAVAAKGCGLLALDTGKVYDAATPSNVIIDDAAAAEAVLKRERIQRAVAVKKERGVTGGRKSKADPVMKAAARSDWLENLAMSQAEVAAKYGVHATTLRRWFGDRGMIEKRGRQKAASS